MGLPKDTPIITTHCFVGLAAVALGAPLERLERLRQLRLEPPQLLARLLLRLLGHLLELEHQLLGALRHAVELGAHLWHTQCMRGV